MLVQLTRFWFGLVFIICIFPVTAIAEYNHNSSCIDWGFSTFNRLDYGIYWFKYRPQGKDQVLKVTANNYSTAIKQGFYNPNKPTVIYFHGWEPGATKHARREDFCYFDPKTKRLVADTLKPWSNKGWNVGIFFWNQFSDDTPLIAQSKIYTPTHMRWKSLATDGTVHTVSGGTDNKSLTQIALENYVLALRNYSGSEVRIVGHSLGSQLAIQFVYQLISDIDEGAITNQHLMPKRLTLLDPVFSPLPVTYLHFENTAKKNYEDLKTILETNPELAVDEYVTSPLSTSTSSHTKKMQQMISFQKLFPKFIDKNYYLTRYGRTEGKIAYDFALHRAARHLYFDSFAYPPPLELPTRRQAPSASTSNARIKQIMGDQYQRIQVSGSHDLDTKNDRFILAPFR